ncbi:nucleolar protein 4 [Anopheles marshallii]|uniref:nucleolar protein 4 n=1 Tax=Anopheles marshallii TaxID=1521116 RepID=UPI00237C4E5F|nr:nucleolar protein 4 [Anopheles marshallii]
MDAQEAQALRTFGPPSECHQSPLDAPGTGTLTSGRRVRTLGDRGASRKRRRLSRSSSSSSTASSVAKVSRLSSDRDTYDVDAGYENDADDDDDDEDDEDEQDEGEEETVGGGLLEDENGTGEDEDEGHTKSGRHVLTTDRDALHRNLARASVRALASGAAGGGSCGEKNGEKSTPFGTADLNAPCQLHQHQQHPASTNYQHYQQQQQLRHNKRPKYDYTRDQMFEIFQPWVIRTYGDRAKTKTITLKKQARIIKTLGGLEMNNPDSSKFRFWVKTKGFTTSKPGNFQDIFTHQNIPENDGCVLYAPSGGLEPGQPYKKVAVVENFFDIIYGVHVSLGSRATRHAGQKRTYRTITETYAFLPREAVTKFLSLCSQCSKLTTKVYSPKSDLKITARVADVVPLNRSPGERFSWSCEGAESKCNKTTDRTQSSLRYYELLRNLYENGKSSGLRSAGELPASGKRANLTSNGASANSAPCSGRMARPGSVASEVLTSDCRVAAGDGNELRTVCASERGSSRERLPVVVGLNNNRSEKGDDEKRRTVPITSTYLDVTRGFGLEDDDALNMDSISMPFNTETTENNGSTANTPGEDAYAGLIKDADKFKLMLLAWNYQNSAAGKSQNGAEGPDLATMTNLWQQYQNALAMTGKTNFNQLPVSERQSSPIEQQQDETNSSEQKDEDDLSEDDSEDRLEATVNDPERLKAFNMFVRLFVDENLDRIIPISKQPKEKIQAIIDSCTRQFPEFAERARKRIRTYLKSCRRNKKTREGWENTSRPTPAHLTSVQAEQILAVACENESLNAKRMRIGLEPISQTVSQPAAVSFMTSAESPTAVPNMYQNLTNREQESTSVSTIKSEPMTSVPKISPVPSTPTPDMNQMKLNIPSASASSTPTIPTTVPTISNFHDYNTGFSNRSQHYQNFMNSVNSSSTSSGATTNTTMSAAGTAAPTDLSMKRPILAHKLNSAEITAVKQLVTGYRESAAFLMRSADELENLLLQQQ